jgi:hypothetical protein
VLVAAPQDPELLQVCADCLLPEQVTDPQTVPTLATGDGQVLEDPEQTAAFVQLVAAAHCVPVL